MTDVQRADAYVVKPMNDTVGLGFRLRDSDVTITEIEVAGSTWAYVTTSRSMGATVAAFLLPPPVGVHSLGYAVGERLLGDLLPS